MKLQAIIPKGDMINRAAFDKELNAALWTTAKEVERDFKATTKTWRRMPDFKVQRGRAGGRLFIDVSTDSDVYRWVSRGTRRHMIRPRRAKALTFRTGFLPKTRPGSLVSGPGGSSGPWRSSKGVMHPGTRARRFEEQITKKHQPRFEQAIQAALIRAAKRR